MLINVLLDALHLHVQLIGVLQMVGRGGSFARRGQQMRISGVVLLHLLLLEQELLLLLLEGGGGEKVVRSQVGTLRHLQQQQHPQRISECD